jgi:hypothetical protein
MSRALRQRGAGMSANCPFIALGYENERGISATNIESPTTEAMQ